MYRLVGPPLPDPTGSPRESGSTSAEASVVMVRACAEKGEYRDGDVARCSMPVGNGTVEVLLVTLFREGDSWRFTIGIE